MQFGTGSTAELTQKRDGQSTKMPCVRPYIYTNKLENARVALVGRARFWGNVDTFNCIGVV